MSIAAVLHNMTPTCSSVACVWFICLLVLLLPAPHDGASSHTSYRSTQVFKTPARMLSGNSQQAPTTATSCSSLPTGPGNNKLPVLHPESPCSPLQVLRSQTAADVLGLGASLVRHRFTSQSPAGTVIPANRASTDMLAYIVLINYGTPEQQFPVLIDTSIKSASLLRCKPCTSGSKNCDPAFDKSRSSTFAQILCGSPDCPTNNCSNGSVCPIQGVYSGLNYTFVKDVLTLSPSMAVNDFRFYCVDVDRPAEHAWVGILDLSMDRDSLPSQLLSSGIAPAATFSYCLPWSPSSQGFLSLGIDASAIEGNVTAQAPLVSHADPKLARSYFIDFIGMSLGDDNLTFPAGTFNNGTMLDVSTSWTYLMPDAYMWLRDSFRKQMSQYSNLSSPGFDGFDTCFNFTGVDEVKIPLLKLHFSNGDSLVIGVHQMLYYYDPTAAPFTKACLAFVPFKHVHSYSAMIGTYTLASMEVIYDAAGGKVGFIPESC